MHFAEYSCICKRYFLLEVKMIESYLTAEEVAEIFKVKVKAVYQWRFQGLEPDIKKPLRFKLSTVEKWLEQRGNE